MKKDTILKHIIVLVLATITFYLYGKLFLESITKLSLTDFHVYYYVTKMVLSENSPTHPYISYTPIYPYFFPPASIPIISLLSFFPFYISKIIWSLVNTILLILSIIYILKSFRILNKVTFLVLSLLALNFYPISFTFRDGQFNIVLLFVFSICLFYFTQQKYKYFLTLLISIGVVSKISPGILLFYSLLKGKFKFILLSIFFVGIFMVLAEIFVQPKINLYYFKTVVSKVAEQSGGLNWTDQSFSSLVKRTNKIYSLKLNKFQQNFIIYTYVVLLISIFLYLERKKEHSVFNEHLNIIILTFISVTGTGLTWFHQYSILFLPLTGMLILSFFYIQKYRKLFLLIFSLVYLSWFLDLSEYVFPNKYLELNMFWGGLIFVIATFYIKANQHLLSSNRIKFSSFSFDDYKYTFWIVIIGAFLVGVRFWEIDSILKESRDATRISQINYIGKKLTKNSLKFQIGESNSFIQNNRIDRGYVLLEKEEFKKIIGETAVLYLDPINSNFYNYKFKSSDGVSFELVTKLESTKFINEYGIEYNFKFSPEKR
jgi:hypothetical protein